MDVQPAVAESADVSYAALLTPVGRGAIATVAAIGPAATRAVAQHFHGGTKLAGAARLRYGRWNKGPGEEVVLYQRAADAVEIHCHGGRAAARAILGSLEDAGCTLLDWKGYLARSTTNRICAEAAEALAAATTQRTACILLDQYEGALSQAVQRVLGDAAVLSSDRPSNTHAGQWTGRVLDLLDELLSRAPVGLHLVEPFRVVIAGRPNVGKSTLINALLGYQRALTSPEAGTTRDLVAAPAALQGWPVTLIDTAGMRQSPPGLERDGVGRADTAMRDADLQVLVFDHSVAGSEDDRRLVDRWPSAVRVANKSDLARCEASLPWADAIEVSALHGAGIGDLAEMLGARLVPVTPPAGSGVPFLQRHVDCLEQARSCASNNHPGGVIEALRELVGERSQPRQPAGP